MQRWVACVFLFFGATFVGVGVWSAWVFAIEPMMNARDAVTWTETTCLVTRSEMAFGQTRKGATTYGADVEYQYTVDGTLHRGSRLSFAPKSYHSTSADAQDELARYPVDLRLPCWYDPAHPDDVTLSREPDASLFSLMAIPCALAAVFFIRMGGRAFAAHGRGHPTPTGRMLYRRRGSSLVELANAAVIAATAIATAQLAFDVGLTVTAWTSLSFSLLSIAWLAHELRCYLSVVTVDAPPEIEQSTDARILATVRTPFSSPPLTIEAHAVEMRKQPNGKWASNTIRRIPAAPDGTLRVFGPPTLESSGDDLTWHLDIRTHLPYGPDFHVKVPLRVR